MLLCFQLLIKFHSVFKCYRCKDNGVFRSNTYASAAEEAKSLIFSSCGVSKWSCVNKTDGLSETITTVSYECENSPPKIMHRYNDYGNRESYYGGGTLENVTLDLSQWEKIAVKTVKIKGCYEVTLRMHTPKPITVETLVIEDVSLLDITPTTGKYHHPTKIIFRDIKFIPKLESRAVSDNATKEVEFKNVRIGTIHKGAINVPHVKSFKWTRVEVFAVKEGACVVSLEDGSEFQVRDSILPVLGPLSFMIKGGSVVFASNKFSMIQEAAIRASVTSFNFTGNVVYGLSGPMYILSPDVTFEKNSLTKFLPQQWLQWKTHINGAVPEIVRFSFIENDFTLYPCEEEEVKGDSLRSCISQVSFIQMRSDNNCSTKLSAADVSESVVYDLPRKDITVLNFLVCNNICMECTTGHAIPSLWNPLEVWAGSFCPAVPSQQIAP